MHSLHVISCTMELLNLFFLLLTQKQNGFQIRWKRWRLRSKGSHKSNSFFRWHQLIMHSTKCLHPCQTKHIWLLSSHANACLGVSLAKKSINFIIYWLILFYSGCNCSNLVRTRWWSYQQKLRHIRTPCGEEWRTIARLVHLVFISSYRIYTDQYIIFNW
jgi:hypothetical protein